MEKNTLLPIISFDDILLQKIQTLLLSGNGGALVLLGSFMNKSDTPIKSLQIEIMYFTPFIFGLIFAASALIFGL